MLLLEISSACSDPALATVLSTLRKIFNLISIIAPIVLIVMVIYHITKMMTNPDDKKLTAKLKNSVTACVMIFSIPTLANLVMGVMGESTSFSACWNSNPSSFGGSSYIDPNGNSNKKNGSLFNDPSEYQNGKKTTNNNSGSTNKSSSSSSSNNNSSSTGGNSNTTNKSSTGVNNPKSNATVFIGDSRTVQMYAYLNSNWKGANYSSGGVHVVGSDVYVAEGSMGLKWMKSTGIPAAEKYFTKGSAIVILMGVNDLGNIDNYLSYVNQNASSWKSNDSSLYFVSVNPCDGSYSKLNSKIESFNSKLKSGLSNEAGYIDTYSVLTSGGFKTTDGLHYDKSTYQTIYNYIKSKV